MRATGFITVLILATAIDLSQACAQTRKETKPAIPGNNEVRYFTSLGGIMDDQADSILKETRTSGKVTSAVLDVCYPAIGNSDSKDRFVATLNIDGQKLTGTTESHEGKHPVTVNLIRKATPGGVTFEGKISIGNRTSNVSSTDNTDIGEKEFQEGQDADDPIIPAPSDFTTASPEAVAMRLKPDDIAAFVNTLRGQSVEVSLMSLLPSCSELRKGEQVVRMNINPERASAFVTRMKTVPGVIASGWTSGKLDMERTIRFSASGWREDGRLNKDKLSATLSTAIAKALSATALAAKWNDDNGELKLTFRRPNAALSGLGLTQTIEFSALAASDKPGNSDQLLLWIGSPTLATIDESPGAKLKLFDASDSGGEDSIPVDDSDTMAVVARELKAQRWDAESSSWK